MYRNQGKRVPSLDELTEAGDYDALAKRGALGHGALAYLARNGDTEASAVLRRLKVAEPPAAGPSWVE